MRRSCGRTKSTKYPDKCFHRFEVYHNSIVERVGSLGLTCGGQGRQGQNAGMGSAGRGGFRRRNGGIEAAGGARRRVLRTRSMGAAEAEKVAGERKRREWGRGLLGAVRAGRVVSHSTSVTLVRP